MYDLVLAIDDNPERYADLAQKLQGMGLLLVALNNPQGVEMILTTGRVLCVLLDHDMPTVENGEVTLKYDGAWFARNVLGPRYLEVCITSANNIGAEMIQNILEEHWVICERISVTNPNHTEEWLRFVKKQNHT